MSRRKTAASRRISRRPRRMMYRDRLDSDVSDTLGWLASLSSAERSSAMSESDRRMVNQILISGHKVFARAPSGLRATPFGDGGHTLDEAYVAIDKLRIAILYAQR